MKQVPPVVVGGDAVRLEMPDGKLTPGIAPAARQEGRHVAGAIMLCLRGKTAFPLFCHKDAGTLATPGKRVAVVDFGWIMLTVRLAWWL